MPATKNKENIYGCWRMIGLKSLDDYEPLDEEFAGCMKGKICYTKDSIIVNNNCLRTITCLNPKYNSQTVSSHAYFENDTAFIKKLSLQDSIDIIEIDCSVRVILVSPDTIILTMDNNAYSLAKD